MKKALIIGYGSIGRKHYKVLKNINYFDKIAIFTKSKNNKVFCLKTLNEIVDYDPDYIIISTSTNEHLKFTLFCENKFKDKKILIEKPIFGNFENIHLKNNKYFVGYNLRLLPLINFIKNKIIRYKFWTLDIECSSFLPKWRNNIEYDKSSSASRKKFGGVLRDLSHEIDYMLYFIGNVKIVFKIKKKISDLKINTDDYFQLIGSLSKNQFVNIKLSYLNKFNKREISVIGPRLQLQASLIKNEVKYYIDNKYFEKKFQINIENTYKIMHLSIIKNQLNNIASVTDGLNVLKFINKIEKNEK